MAAPNLAIARRDPPRSAWRWWVVAWLLFAVICAATISYFAGVFVPRERATTIDLWRGRLFAMADDRKAAITAWLAERRGDAQVVSEYPTVAILLGSENVPSHPQSATEQPQRRLEGLFDSLQAAYGYSGVYVIGLTGQTVASSTDSPPLGISYRQMNSEVLQSGLLKIDFPAQADGVPMLAVVVPVRMRGRIVGTVLLSVDPERWLYPLLRSEPVPSATGESLLVRQVGDQIEYLSPLRHRSAQPLSFRLPTNAAPLASIAALRGEEGFKEYLDYRGVAVMGAGRRIPRTGWGLVVKVDRDEALAGFGREVRRGALLLAGLLLAVAGLGFGAERTLAARHRRELSESEARFALLRDHAREGIWFVNQDALILDANESAAAMHGCTREELIGHNVREFRPPGGPEEVPNLLAAMRPHEGVAWETVHARRDGSVFPIEVSSRVANLKGKEVYISVFREITELKRAQEALRESEGRYRSLFEQSPIGIYRTTPGGRILLANPRLLEMLGYTSLEELLARNLEESGFEPDYPRQQFKDAVERAGAMRGFEAIWVTKDGQRLSVRENAQAIRGADGKTLYYDGSVEDVTKERQAQEALHRSEANYRHLFENATDAIVVFEPETETVLDANPKACELYGYQRGELLGTSLKRLTFDVPRGERRVAELLREGSLKEFETIHVRRGGTPIQVQVNASVVDFGGARAILSTHRDITEQKLAEEERRRLVAAIEQSAEAVVITDRDGAIRYVNPGFEWITGYRADEVIGVNPRILKSGKQAPTFYAEMWNTITHGSVWMGKLSNRRKDGSLYEEEMSISPVRDEDGTIINFVAVGRDVTRELELQQQLNQAQKMEAVGRLAGGVAHDFNNLLQALISHVQLLRSKANDANKITSLSRDMEQLIGRGASLTRQLLLFSRRETVKPEHLDLNEQVREASKMLQRLVRANISLRIELAGGRLGVDADRGQLDQVLMNLVVNASDSMPDGGELTVRTGTTDHTHVWLSVEDTGAGIPEEIRERIFEPFFTTKGAAKGTGLGLSVVHGIVTQHGGQIEVESAVGRGTTFRVILPESGSGEFPVVKEVPGEAAELPMGRGERILVVEDEEIARQGLHDILVSLNYEVVSVGSGEAARSLPVDPPFDVLLTDLMLPGVAGPELAAGLQEQWPSLKVILMSGYTEDEAVRSVIGAGDIRFLQKPFDMTTLAREVRAALDDSRGALKES
jgi:two-component system, cell cycle sensor histidine kinase and response regulator CckA